MLFFIFPLIIGRFDFSKCFFSYFHISEVFDKLDVSLFLAYILLHVFYKCYFPYGRISKTCGRLTFSPIWSFKDTCDAKIYLSTFFHASLILWLHPSLIIQSISINFNWFNVICHCVCFVIIHSIKKNLPVWTDLTFRCHCEEGWKGEECDVRLDECEVLLPPHHYHCHIITTVTSSWSSSLSHYHRHHHQ